MIDLFKVIEELPDKREYSHTTSHKFKMDIVEYFGDRFLDKNCLEIGTASGHTTRLLSFLFKTVRTMELLGFNIETAKNLNKDRNNIEYIEGDVYQKNTTIESTSSWWIEGAEENEKDLFSVSFIDCVHAADNVFMDMETSIENGTDDLIFIFDDYGLPEENPSVKVAVDRAVGEGKIRIIKYIGEPAGSEPREGRKLIDWEGVICQLN